MNLSSITLALFLIGSSSALTSPSLTSRKSWLQNVGGTAAALLVPGIASASLLDDYGSDPTKIGVNGSAIKKGVEVASVAKATTNVEPSLKASYYYPTNKKRYLPRIKKCNDAIPGVANSIGDGEWTKVEYFAEAIADDTILPLKLYTSSLGGQGTNVKLSFTKTMSKDADTFEKNQKLLLKAIAKKDTIKASTALEGMATALQEYRTVASLTGPDGGGDIPSVDDIRRAACRVQGRSFELKVMARDQRIEDQTSSNNMMAKN
mmetsp:Transcript_32526/g.36999  ORF Transcript_32526/g.36999 Transcript_32526/m.36999 type:complete len:263 (+) Transcript_32526:135-923(+)